jgi:hypothetical protein
MISQTSLTAALMSKFYLKRENLLFCILPMSRQSSITFYKCNDEFRTIFNDLIVFGGISLTVESIIIIILSMGIIELRGVLSSWATDEKNMFLIFCISF